jgi:hypothetical protein
MRKTQYHLEWGQHNWSLRSSRSTRPFTQVEGFQQIPDRPELSKPLCYCHKRYLQNPTPNYFDFVNLFTNFSFNMHFNIILHFVA